MSDDEVIEIMYEAMQKPLDALTDILGLSEKERDTLDSLPAEKFTQFVSYVTTMIWTNGKGRDEEVKPEKSQPAKKTIRAGRHARRS
ncbi:hypothetical protein IV38_GL001961 [Lactobacillus selangorensis]|uniref:Uncharacterized protein n=2 Tax=Lactobacillus selangorensis TaxID=81857 RepID=A0A0R2FPC8_9LACO|nr:hypothetical protein IV38_GL001961 [Lactobacillus selangorensis]KRN30288.1 hypothetical protein IV40_GL001876 [Lactobacillus selangorensis]